MADRTVLVRLQADVGSYVSNLDKAARSTSGLGRESEAMGARTAGSMERIKSGAMVMGGVLGGAVALGIKDVIGKASDLNETLNKSNVIFGANAGQVSSWAENASTSFGLSQSAALEAAASFGNMFQQLGFTGGEAVSASENVVKLAADLGSFNNLETGDVLERIQAAFRGEYDSLQLLIPNISAARVEQEAMAETGKKNKDALTAQEKATAVLAIVQKDGAAAADDFAETSGGLANQTKIAAAQFSDLQAEIGQKFLPIATSAMSFVNSTALPALSGIFDVVSAAAGAFAALPGPVQTGVVALGAMAALKGPLGGFFDGMGGSLRTLGSNIGGTFSTFNEALGYARANGDGLGTVLRSVGDYAGGAMKGGLSSLVGFFGGPWGLALTGASVGLSLLVDWLGKSDSATRSSESAQRDFASALQASKGQLDENVRAAAAKRAQDEGLLSGAEAAGVSVARVTDAVLGQTGALDEVRGRMQTYHDDLLAQSDAAARANNPALSADLWNRAQAVQGNIDVLGRLNGDMASQVTAQQQLSAATQSSSATQAAAQTAAEGLASQLDGMSKAASAAKQQTDLLKLSLDILSGNSVSMIQVESAFQAAVDDARGAMENLTGRVLDNTGHLDLNSEAGRKAADVLLGVRDSGNQLIATMIQQGASTDEVTAKDAQLRASFIKSAEQMGISQRHASDLADQILGIPAERRTTIEADTRGASANVGGLQRQIDDLHGKTVTVSVVADRTAMAVFQQTQGRKDAASILMSGFAGGGYTGAGGKYAPAGVVHKGEYVEPQETVDYYRGTGILEALHQRSIPREAIAGLPGYAGGGIVVEGDGSGLASTARTLGGLLWNQAAREAQGVLGTGSLSGTWTAIFGAVKAAFPQARANSTYRPGDPGYHGRNKAVDFGFGTGPGGAGNAGLAAINRWLYDRFGGNLAELIYDGLGDDRPDVKNGRNHTYNAATRAQHANHVHAAVYHQGTDYVPNDGWAFLARGEQVVPAQASSREFTGANMASIDYDRLAKAVRSGPAGRSGPLQHVENMYVSSGVDIDLELQRAAFRERAGVFG